MSGIAQVRDSSLRCARVSIPLSQTEVEPVPINQERDLLWETEVPEFGLWGLHQCATTCPAGQGSSSRISLGCLGEELAKILKCGAQRGGLGTCDGSEPAQHR